MAFFEPPPASAEPEPLPSRARPPAWFDAPDDELPAVVPLEHFVHCTGRVLVAAYHAEVYRQGCSVHVQVIVGRSGESEQRWRELGAVVLGGVERRFAVEEGRIPDDLVRFGVQYADGTKATTLDAVPDASHASEDVGVEPPRPPVIKRQPKGGRGAEDRLDHEQRLWLWPLPPAEPFDLVVEWPAAGVPLTRVTVDGAALQQAAERVRPLWDD